MFDTSYFDSPLNLVYGALTGLVFGFLLHKGGVSRYETIQGQFLLRDFTVLRVMLTAIVVGSVGVYGMLALGWLEGLHVKAAHVALNGVGGAIFGVGMALYGYCPGTGVAAVGAGTRDAVPGVLGMLAGAALYAETSGFVDARLKDVGALGKETFASWLGLSPWWFVAALGLLLLVVAVAPLPRGGAPSGRVRERHA